MVVRCLLPLLAAVFAFAAQAAQGGSSSYFDSTVSLTANDSTAVAVGGTVSLTAKVSNLGNAAGTDTLYIDISNVFTVSSTSCNATVQPQSTFILVSWQGIALSANQVRTCSVSLRLTQQPPAGATTAAYATLSDGGSNTDNNSASHTFHISATPVSDLGVVLSGAPVSAQPGTEFPVTATVSNDGPSPATNTLLTVTVPANLRLDRTSCVGGTLPKPFVWSVGTLAADGSRSCTLTYTILNNSVSPANIVADIDSDSSDPKSGNDRALAAIDLGGYKNVKLDVDASDPGPVEVGDIYSYTLTLRNSGNTGISSGTAINTLPDGVSLQSGSCVKNSNGTLTWTIPAVAGNASTSCSFSVKVNALPADHVLHDSASAAFQFLGGLSGAASAVQDISTVRPAAPAARTASGLPTTKNSLHPALSADGQLVAFASADSGFVAGDANGANSDIYLVDRRSGATRLVSVADVSGAQLPGNSDMPKISGNGQAIAFLYTGTAGAALRTGQAAATTATTTTICVSPPNGLFRPTCLLGNNGQPINGPAESPSLSADGRYMAFCSSASNIPGTTDTNGRKDVFVLDQTLGQVKLVSTTTGGAQGNGDSCEAMISGDGKSVVFTSVAQNFGTSGSFREVFKKDLASNALSLVSRGVDGNPATSEAVQPSVSYDGKRITFVSRAANLASGVSSAARYIWVYDDSGSAGTSNKLDVVRGAGGVLPNNDSEAPAISCNGRIVAFDTRATNLSPPDTNNVADVYLYDIDNKVVRRAVAPQAGVEPNGAGADAVLDCEGNTMAFASEASNLSPGDPNGNDDIYGQEAPLRSDAAAITVDASFSGNWYNPGNDGHGFLIEALSLPGTPFYVTWYVFKDGQPIFLQGVANAVGNTLTVDMTTAKSTAFPVGAGGATNTAWGKVKLTFTDAGTGLAEWTPTAAGFTAGSFNLRRLTTPALIQSDAGQTLKACYSGIWGDVARPGYGLDLEVNDFGAATRLLTIYWYTYQPNGAPLWLVGTGAAANGKVTADLYQVNGAGAQFPPNYAKPGTTAAKWGSATVQFTTNDAAVFTWTPGVTGYTSGSGALKRLTSLATRGCQ